MGKEARPATAPTALNGSNSPNVQQPSLTAFERLYMGKEARPATAPTGLNGPSSLNVQHPSVGLNPHESVVELREFLKVARPEWSHYHRNGSCNIDKVMAKLKSIGVNDYWDLMGRVETNTINEDLHAAGKVVFSKKTMEHFRQQKSILLRMENLRAPFYRQTGHFAPAPQLLSKQNIWATAASSTTSISSLPSKPPAHSPRPGTAPGNQRRKRSDAVTPLVMHMAAAAGQRPHSVPTGSFHTSSAGSSCASRRPRLRYVRTGKEHFCWSPLTKESLTDAADACEDNTQSLTETGTGTGTMGRSRESLDLSSTVPRSATVADYAESEVDSVALEQQFAKFKRAGSAMGKAELLPRWNNLTSDTLLAHGEAMLGEQTQVDMKTDMIRAFRREGPDSTLRKVITGNIAHRLREEAPKDAKSTLDCHYGCASIRKNLNSMVNSRRDLNNVKLQAMKALGEEEKVDYAEKFSFMRQTMHSETS